MRDEDGLIYILGRSDDTIKVSGKRTGPSEIETLLTGTGKADTCLLVLCTSDRGLAGAEPRVLLAIDLCCWLRVRCQRDRDRGRERHAARPHGVVQLAMSCASVARTR